MGREEFVRRRRQLMRMIGREGIAILPAAPVRYRNSDVEYPYRQDSDFHYLTGFPEPDAVAVLIPGRPQAEYILFVRERDPERELWDGSRAGPEGATSDYAADDAFPIADIDEILPGLLEQRTRVFYTMGIHQDFDQRVVGWVGTLRTHASQGTQIPQEFVALDHLLHDMRLYKNKREIDAMRRAAQVGVKAHARAMRACRPGLREYQIEAELMYEFRRANAHTSYLPIVAAGRNACVLHYRDNDAQLRDGELLLIDAGCEFDNYACDITRTFPVNGRFSSEQRSIYDVVLRAQRAAIDKIRAGNHWDDPHNAAVRAITEGLLELGLLKGKLPALLKEEAYRKFFMHRTGHWLGLDVHDVGDYKVGGQWRVLEPGMAMTVEPGIYIPAATPGVARRWWNIGIRIEDDVLVTRGKPEVLTRALPREADAVEKLVQGSRA